MNKLIRIILNNILSIWNIKKILICITIFFSINLLTKNIYDIYNVNDIIKFSFYGTNNLTELPIELFKWISCQIFLIYLILDFVNKEFKNRSLLLLLRIGSKKLWIKGLVISILISCFLYYILGFVILIILNCNLIFSSIDIFEVFNIYLVLTLTSFSICLIATLFSMYINSESVIFTIIIFLYYLSISLGNISGKIDRFFIFNQSIIIKHYYSNFTFKWSFAYNILFSLILYVIIENKILKNDL